MLLRRYATVSTSSTIVRVRHYNRSHQIVRNCEARESNIQEQVFPVGTVMYGLQQGLENSYH